MDNAIVEIGGFVVEGTSDILFAMDAIKAARQRKKWSSTAFQLQGKPVRVWYRGHYWHKHRFSSHQGRACPLGRGRAG